MTLYHGWEATIRKDGTAVAYCTSVSCEINGNREGVYQMGSRNVQEFKAGNLEITGSIDHIWADHTFGEEVDADEATEYTMRFDYAGSGVSTQYITLTGVIWKNWSQDIPEDGLITESIDFQASAASFT